ncbi:MAG: hypothetical protein CO029_03480 [Candidatus Magasanikbacteria bacterium CG_4_9_14_0_2_um_filter_41_10]|uniref:Uncharacterized protein n=1 Tax=Candidatus Magasanikbacteria bacterium CG_4_10_14_0_2_um_filter_41_31 TaxID=1974639 RepID=A0A2M7V5G8_9BACT|nr:MAG: hypothetical protein COX83_00825 [Candidatus Magasanikbacteria bacterium CG_4_10_14_0_2_um_filter_41_31]PJC53295.1 MAG: hypothetical protein CO029_03480 [Candidatus Magasanikbacteria bacterium CG_4_9_14_0_2_um_filter_41_10]
MSRLTIGLITEARKAFPYNEQIAVVDYNGLSVLIAALDRECKRHRPTADEILETTSSTLPLLKERAKKLKTAEDLYQRARSLSPPPVLSLS